MLAGFTEATAKNLIIAEVKEFKKNVVEKTLQQKKDHEAQTAACVIMMIVSLLGSVFGVESGMWTLVLVCVAALCGYFGFKNKPIAGIASFIIFALIFPYTYNWYLTGRSTYINIELLIPTFIAVAPAAVVYFLLAFTVYRNSEDY